MIPITRTISVDEKEIKLHFVRSPGPGGQNVNKVASAVELRFDVMKSRSLPEDVRMRLMHLAGGRINRGGIISIDAHQFRTQQRNRKDAIRKLVLMILKAAEKKKPRIKTKLSKAVKEDRMRSKKKRGEVKKMRKLQDFE